MLSAAVGWPRLASLSLELPACAVGDDGARALALLPDLPSACAVWVDLRFNCIDDDVAAEVHRAHRAHLTNADVVNT